MFRTIRSPLLVALVVLFVASAVALAADATMLGTVQKLDVQKGRITLQSTEGKSVELQAPAALLAGLETGDAVEVKMSGQKATMIHRLEGAQQTDMGSTKQKQRPGGMRQTE
jgi:Cu/Ag efflux protein CusF